LMYYRMCLLVCNCSLCGYTQHIMFNCLLCLLCLLCLHIIFFFVRAASIDGLVPFLVAWLLCQINIIIFWRIFGTVKCIFHPDGGHSSMSSLAMRLWEQFSRDIIHSSTLTLLNRKQKKRLICTISKNGLWKCMEQLLHSLHTAVEIGAFLSFLCVLCQPFQFYYVAVLQAALRVFPVRLSVHPSVAYGLVARKLEQECTKTKMA